MRAILPKEEGPTCAMQLVPSVNKVLQESNGIGMLLSGEKDVGPVEEGISLVIRETVAGVARRKAER